MTRKSLRGKLVGRCSGGNEKADGKATLTPKLVVPDNAVYLTHSRRYWSSLPNPGECEIKVEVLHWEPEPGEDTGPLVILWMRWSGECDSPEEWTIRWVHFLDYLGGELPGYLREYSPAPEQMLYQLVSALEPQYARYFGPSKLDEWKALVERESESAAESE